jgi:hypothetical protein
MDVPGFEFPQRYGRFCCVLYGKDKERMSGQQTHKYKERRESIQKKKIAGRENSFSVHKIQ